MNEKDNSKDTEKNTIDNSRRDAIDRLGKLGLITAPAMLTLLMSNKATAASHIIE